MVLTLKSLAPCQAVLFSKENNERERKEKGRNNITHFLYFDTQTKIWARKNIKYTNGNKTLFLTAQCDLSSVENEITIFIRKSLNVSGKAITIS